MTDDNPWPAAGRAARVSQAADRIRAATDAGEVDAILRGALSAIVGRSVSVRMRAGFSSLASVREAALGLLRGAVRSPETFPRAVLGQRLPGDDRAYAVTRDGADGPGVLVVNSLWWDDRTRAEFVASLIADRDARLPDNPADLIERHVTTTRQGVGEHRSEPAPHRRPDPLERYDRIIGARSVDEVAAQLRAALTDIAGAPVSVDLGSDATTDLGAARHVARGLIWELLGSGLKGPSTVEVGEPPQPYADAYAATVPLPDGSYKVVFNHRWHGAGRGEQLRESLEADASASPGAPRDPKALAARQAAPPPTAEPYASASPRGEATPYEHLDRIAEADGVGEIERAARDGLGAALGHQVDVSFGRFADVETVREVSDELIRASLENPGAKLRSVRVDRLDEAIGMEFAHTRVRTDASFDIVFNTRWHVAGARDAYLDELRSAHDAGRIPDPSPGGIARLRLEVPGTTALTVADYGAHIEASDSTAEVEAHLREALVAVTGAPVAVTLQAPGSRHVTSVRSAKDVARGLIDAAAEYPGTELRSVQVAEILNDDRTIDMKTYAHALSWKDRPTELAFNAPWHSGNRRDAYVGALAKEGRDKFSVASTPYDVAVHELAHAVAESIPDWTESQTVGGHPESLRDEVRTKTHGRGDMWHDVAGSVSTYARKNDHELTAEAVNDTHKNGDSAARVSVVITKRLRDAHAQRTPPLEPLRRDTHMARTAQAADIAQRGLGSVHTMRTRLPREHNVESGPSAPAESPPGREPPAHHPARATRELPLEAELR